MEKRLLIAQYDEIDIVAKALNSKIRREMLRILRDRELNINQLASLLSIPQSTCTVNVKILEQAQLIHTRQVAASKGAQKMCSLNCDEVVLPIIPEEQLIEHNTIEIDMPIGLYTDNHITPPCGLASETGIIGLFDKAGSFLDPHRAVAQIIWFTKGHLEYSFPLNLPENRKIRSVSISLEVCSEFPGYKNTWPSDITLWINQVEIGTWTSPGDMGGSQGKLTPQWWTLKNTQYGFLKTWSVTSEGSFIDSTRVGDTNLDDIRLEEAPKLTVHIGIKDNARNIGGMNIFGKKFGNYDQDLRLSLLLEPPV